MKALIVLAMTMALGLVLVGCDEATIAAALPNELGKLVTADRGTGDLTMDQIQQRDQLRLQDGTGANCPTGGAAQAGTGQGSGDRLRLRDGSCQ